MIGTPTGWLNWGSSGYKSGYRTPEINEIMGGVWNSNHRYGCAADIHEGNTDATAEALAETIKAAAEYNGLLDRLNLVYIRAKDGAI